MSLMMLTPPLASFIPGLPDVPLAGMLSLLAVVFAGVLVADSIGNLIAFDNRVTNALVTAVIATFLVIAVNIVINMDGGVSDDPTVFVAVGVVVFVADLVGNSISFRSRMINALVTAIVASVIVAVLQVSGVLQVFV